MEKDIYAGTNKMVIIDNEIDKKAINDAFWAWESKEKYLVASISFSMWQARYLFFLSQSFEIMISYGIFLMLSIPSMGSL